MNNALDLEEFKEEFMDGKVYYMSPSANPKHGRVIGNIYFVFKSYLRGKKCQVFTDTIDVYLDHEKKDKDNLHEEEKNKFIEVFKTSIFPELSISVDDIFE